MWRKATGCILYAYFKAGDEKLPVYTNESGNWILFDGKLYPFIRENALLIDEEQTRRSDNSYMPKPVGCTYPDGPIRTPNQLMRKCVLSLIPEAFSALVKHALMAVVFHRYVTYRPELDKNLAGVVFAPRGAPIDEPVPVSRQDQAEDENVADVVLAPPVAPVHERLPIFFQDAYASYTCCHTAPSGMIEVLDDASTVLICHPSLGEFRRAFSKSTGRVFDLHLDFGSKAKSCPVYFNERGSPWFEFEGSLFPYDTVNPALVYNELAERNSSDSRKPRRVLPVLGSPPVSDANPSEM